MNNIIKKVDINSFINYIIKRENPIDCSGLYGSADAYLISRICEKYSKNIIIVVSNNKKADILINELEFFLRNSKWNILYFPGYNLSPFKKLSYHNRTAARRIKVLYKMVYNRGFNIIVTTISSIIQKLIPKKELCDYAEIIINGEEIDRDFLIQKLIAGRYTKSIIVEEPGDFAVRGGIIDIYSPMHSNPIRVEFFGDMVESLRIFNAGTQRKIDTISEALIIPARESILKSDNIDNIIERIKYKAKKFKTPYKTINEIENNLKEGADIPEIEGLLSLIYKKPDTFFDYINNEALFILNDYVEIEKSVNIYWSQIYKNFETSQNESKICVDPEELYIKYEDLNKIFLSKNRLAFRELPENVQFSFNIKDNSDLTSDLKKHYKKENILLPLVNWIKERINDNLIVLIVCGSKVGIDRVKFFLEPYGIKFFESDSFKKGRVYLKSGYIREGFIWESESIAIISESEIFGVKRIKRKSKRIFEKITTSDLEKGNLIVHQDHGIGRYDGLIKLKLGKFTGDFLLIYYRDDDKLYLPVERMSVIQKYMGIEGFTPILDKLGGKSWDKVKKKVKKSVEKIAGELLNIYAARKVYKGYSFSRSKAYIKDFEAGFSYDETQDQISAIEDVLQDMEKDTPMDRLVCGDVGYGKTEVALRASFLSVNENKQVAILVPTTILSEQHLKTFIKRFKKYPVVIEGISRFRTKKEQKDIVKRLAEGKIDIIIGTHRLLQKDIKFKDLGLVILDEEQRFGVKHKEKLKKFRKIIDVLTLTATPIPRTLHLSLTGIRDISVISTPPEHRLPITTYLSEFDDTVVIEALRRELSRNGQIFFVHNNINSINKMAARLKRLVPEIKLGVAHGRMSERELENVMLKFLNKEIDMMVCTTIIESGLDIPSVNTMIVNRADRFGLSQMHQLRGRIGRSEDQAYAYLFIPKESMLSSQARKRLKVLMEYSDLGSGFQIAMNDLKIRGGGTILGSSQSGHISAVGYDMFLQLMENTVAEMKGETIIEKLDPEINIQMSAFFPENYINNIDQRLSAYRRLAKMIKIKEISDFKEELIDRYGQLPLEVKNLLLKIILKIYSIHAGVERLDIIGKELSLKFSIKHIKKPESLVKLSQSKKSRYKLSIDNLFKIKLSGETLIELLSESKKILKEIKVIINK